MTEERVQEFKRNNTLEDLLKDINGRLGIVEEKLAVERKQQYPVVFVMGPPRSGTTLMLQWLASTGEVAYPTNLLSRFYGAPIMGAKIQKLLTDEKYNFRNEILDFNTKQNFHSENGKTKGALSPNEFWYFWRRFLEYEGEIEYIEDEKLLKQQNMYLMKNELVGITDEFQKPFVLKGLICNYNIRFLNQMYDKAIFIYTKRSPYTNIQSLLNARERQFSDINTWYSFKIPEYPQLMKITNPIKQVAGQVYHMNKAVENGLNFVEDSRKIIVEYEDFCSNPEKYYKELSEKIELQGYKMNPVYAGEKEFIITRKNIEPEIRNIYDEYVREIQGK